MISCNKKHLNSQAFTYFPCSQHDPQQYACSRDYPSQKTQWHEPTRWLSSRRRAVVQCVQGGQRSCICDDYRIWAVLTRRSRGHSEPSDSCRGMAGIRKGSRRRQQRVCACVNT